MSILSGAASRALSSLSMFVAASVAVASLGQAPSASAAEGDPPPVLGGQLFSTGAPVTVEVLAAAGGVASSSAYSVFGQPVGTGPVGLGDVYGYTGHAWDADAGMHYARARWYDAGVGRFASEDPVDAMNLYTYVGNQPVSFIDPTGEMAFDYHLMGDLGGEVIVANMALIGAIGDRVLAVWEDLWRDQQCLHMNAAGAALVIGGIMGFWYRASEVGKHARATAGRRIGKGLQKAASLVAIAWGVASTADVWLPGGACHD